MRRTIFILPLFLLLGATSSHMPVDTIVFDINDSRSKLGELTVSRQKLGDYTTVRVQSEIKITKIFTLRISHVGVSEYKNGTLMKAENTTKVNGHEHSSTTLRWANDHYQLSVDGKERQITDPVHYSGSLMYFQEPLRTKTVFAEKAGTYEPIFQLGNGRYQVEKEDGSRHTYTYREGRLERIEYPHSLTDIIVQRK